MKNSLYLCLLALVMLLFWSCQKDDSLLSSAEDIPLMTRALDKNAVTPFKGEYTTYPRIIDEGPLQENGLPTFQVAIVEAEGKATHLGNSQWYAEGYVDYTVFPFTQVGPCYFVSANKDTLFGTYEGTIQLFESNPLFTGQGSYEITHGTGRFEGTTGSGVYEYEVNLTPEYALEGKLLWDGVLINP